MDDQSPGPGLHTPRRTTLSPWTAGHKSTIYSPKRILTPLKRVDFDPKGDRNIHKRGESGYEAISWDEALDIVSEEMIRLKREVGPAAIMTTPSSHHMWGNVGYRFSAYNRFVNLWGMTYIEHNPDSWKAGSGVATTCGASVRAWASPNSTTCSRTLSRTRS